MIVPFFLYFILIYLFCWMFGWWMWPHVCYLFKILFKIPKWCMCESLKSSKKKKNISESLHGGKRCWDLNAQANAPLPHIQMVWNGIILLIFFLMQFFGLWDSCEARDIYHFTLDFFLPGTWLHCSSKFGFKICGFSNAQFPYFTFF